jgi:Zn-dependent protease with chaperone function
VRLAVYLPLLVPLAAALFGGRLAPRPAPRLAAWLLAVSAVALAMASTAALGLLVLAGLIQLPLVAGLAHLSLGDLRRDDIPTLSVCSIAGIALCAASMAAIRMAWRRMRALLKAATEAQALPGYTELVVMQDDRAAEAFTLPGRPGRIVVSTGMLAALDRQEQRALLAHERAHLRHGHHWFIAAAHLAAAANPLLRPLARALAFTLERWADEDAAAELGDRGLVARAVARAALATTSAARTTASADDRAPAPREGLVLGINGEPAGSSDLSGAGPVPRRVAALLAPPPVRRPLVVIAIAAVLVATGLCTLDAIQDLHTLIENATA